MADIERQFPIARDVQTVFAAMTTPAGLNAWWTQGCEGAPSIGAWYAFDFGLNAPCAGVVSKCEAPHAFEWTMEASDVDWRGSRVGFTLIETTDGVG
jgi:uncharacterized protein YndB with AHSA1/START domain